MWIGHDRGSELSNVMNEELTALLGVTRRLSGAWRPWELGPCEREHQETQRSLGMLLSEIVRCAPEEWSTLLPVVEFIRFNTPGKFGLTPRDLEKSWSLASPLERELLPLEPAVGETVTELAK